MDQITGTAMCPICNREVFPEMVNEHIDSGCKMGFKKRPTRDVNPPLESPRKLASMFRNHPTAMQQESHIDMKTPKIEMNQPDLKPSGSLAFVPEVEYTYDLSSTAPLAEIIRPRTVEEFFGQEELMGKSGLLKSLISCGKIPSMLFWGPPGCGKTTLAKVIGRTSDPPVNFKAITSVTHGIDEVKKIIEQSKNHRRLTGQNTILFVDEIHRYTKAQQDYFLPAVEQGLITLLAATTENPSFRLNSALLSRCKVFVLEKLEEDALLGILKRAQQVKLSINRSKGWTDPHGKQAVCDEGLKYIGRVSDGDARTAINALEMVLDSLEDFATLSLDQVKHVIQRTHMHYDNNGEEHYNLISALHKSIRGSSVEGALYWLGRMLYSGEDPLYIGRRLIRIASEDIGLADSQALPLAVSTFQSCQMVGMPECDVMLAHCAAYLAQAPKSVQVYRTMKMVKQLVKNEPSYPVPLHIRNAPTKLMQELNYGKGYIYNPDYPSDHEASKSQTYLPPELERDGIADTLRELMKK
ncbi:DNA-dependent ATPase mgs1 [Entomophthora muscae]|uniref:DNA-dependent ATPase mgs1 n=2 Tax=Entomophthora muscae TaxID=34485 RepID=A0ACC2TV22_9FUNG|nr:DNA-dependent ATPase mgs1 [Entomophthora muscae]